MGPTVSFHQVRCVAIFAETMFPPRYFFFLFFTKAFLVPRVIRIWFLGWHGISHQNRNLRYRFRTISQRDERALKRSELLSVCRYDVWNMFFFSRVKLVPRVIRILVPRVIRNLVPTLQTTKIENRDAQPGSRFIQKGEL